MSLSASNFYKYKPTKNYEI